MRGFEADERKVAEWKGSKTLRGHKDIERQPHDSPKPSTSFHRPRPRQVDPLAKARHEWNKGIKQEYAEKFEQWKIAKSRATPGIFLIN